MNSLKSHKEYNIFYLFHSNQPVINSGNLSGDSSSIKFFYTNCLYMIMKFLNGIGYSFFAKNKTNKRNELSNAQTKI